jgi:hypothetical protein
VNLAPLSRELKALNRARVVERAKHNAGNQRTTLFFDRYLEKYRDVVRSRMPFAQNGVTVKDWVLRRAMSGKEVPNLADLRRGLVSLGPRGPISDRKFWLFVLACYATNAGIRLGAERLTALANCADPDSELDPRALARFLASLPSKFKVNSQRDIRNLPAVPLIPPQG